MEPVKAIFWTRSCDANAAPAVAPKPFTIFITPGGNPAWKNANIQSKYRLIMRNKIWLYFNRQLGHVKSSQWCLLSWFHYNGTPSSQSRTPFPSEHQNWKVLYKKKINSSLIPLNLSFTLTNAIPKGWFVQQRQLVPFASPQIHFHLYTGKTVNNKMFYTLKTQYWAACHLLPIHHTMSNLHHTHNLRVIGHC